MTTQTMLGPIARAARVAAALLPVAAISCAGARDDAERSDETDEALTACAPSWTQVPSPNVGSHDNVLAAVAGRSPRDVWAVGQLAPDDNPDITQTLAEHFDGERWSVVTTPNVGTDRGNALLAVTARRGVAWAVGYYIGDDFLAHALIEAWDGDAW